MRAGTGHSTVGGVAAEELAARFGTPLYVYDAATLRERAQAYVDGVAGHPDAHVSFACKACCTVGVLRLLGALRTRRRRRQRGRARGRAARRHRARAASSCTATARPTPTSTPRWPPGAACWCWTAPDEGARVAAAAARHGRRQPVAVRVTPGIVAGGHEKIATGARGLEVRPRAGRRGCARCLEARDDPRLDWRGLHVHLGSQVDDPGVLEGVVRWFAEFCDAHALEPRLIDVGGGLGIPYGDESAPGRRARSRRRSSRPPPRAVPRRAAR